MVKCKDCGYLAVRDEYNDQICEAVDSHALRASFRFSPGVSRLSSRLIRFVIARRGNVAALLTPIVRIAACL